MKKIKSLGILGLGSRSTVFYIEELHRIYNEKMKGYGTFPFKMLQLDFDLINNQLPNRSRELDELIRHAFNKLESLKIDIALVPNITLHETIDHLKLKTKLIHPLSSTKTKIQKNNYQEVVLIASFHSMNSDYIKSYFSKYGITVVLPSQEEMHFIDLVRKEVYTDTASSQTLEQYNLLIENYAQRFAVVIACTELSIAFKNTNRNHVFDMSRIQIQQAMSEIVG